ncbi:MAG: hypothetical protein GC145_16430 [Caulobacter sp.]|nr:hypothetical protein [Caulobacter sp.]
MTPTRPRNLGLYVLVAFLVLLTGFAIHQGASVPDGRSCVKRVAHLVLQGEDHPGERGEIARLCRPSRGPG